MKIYIIGGWIRDTLMNKKPNDKDFVVVGSSAQEMIGLGYKQIGKEFPVFIHPETKQEYALARTEQKTGPKHTDFIFHFSKDVTLKDDCLRRDFTCNSIAFDEETGEYIDYFNGQKDIQNKLIRIIDEHHFKQDPLRILRAFRFAATLDFDIEPETKKILGQMVANGMLKHLTPERVWLETEKALAPHANSVKFFTGLAEVNGLLDWFGALDTVKHNNQLAFIKIMNALNRVRDKNSVVKWAVLNHTSGHLIKQISDQLKTPKKYQTTALMFFNQNVALSNFNNADTEKQYHLVKEISHHFKNQQQLEDILSCFYACYDINTTDNTGITDSAYIDICNQIRSIFNIMKNVTLSDLSEKEQHNLSKQTGKKFGAMYQKYLIRYLKQHLIQQKKHVY